MSLPGVYGQRMIWRDYADVQALVILHGYVGSPEPSQIPYALSANISFKK